MTAATACRTYRHRAARGCSILRFPNCLWVTEPFRVPSVDRLAGGGGWRLRRGSSSSGGAAGWAGR